MAVTIERPSVLCRVTPRNQSHTSAPVSRKNHVRQNVPSAIREQHLNDDAAVGAEQRWAGGRSSRLSPDTRRSAVLRPSRRQPLQNEAHIRGGRAIYEVLLRGPEPEGGSPQVGDVWEEDESSWRSVPQQATSGVEGAAWRHPVLVGPISSGHRRSVCFALPDPGKCCLQAGVWS